MTKPTVAYTSFCCAKDRDRAIANYWGHYDSHKYAFDERFFIFQRCDPNFVFEENVQRALAIGLISSEDYAPLLGAHGIKYPDPVLDELTHGWGAPHFWAHHMVNHLKAAHLASADYIVFADADCYIKESPEGKNWVDAGIEVIENNRNAFVVSPNDGGDGRPERIMSQQMFLVNRKKFLEMEFIPWDGLKIDGGPFQEYYGLLEGWIHRYMEKTNQYRWVLTPEFRYWHKEWH